MPTSRNDRSAADRLLTLADRFAALGRPAMAEAARRAAANALAAAPGFTPERRRARPLADDADLGR
jgi:argininosuccinate lyase